MDGSLLAHNLVGGAVLQAAGNRTGYRGGNDDSSDSEDSGLRGGEIRRGEDVGNGDADRSLGNSDGENESLYSDEDGDAEV
jgi:hypothetical protein